MVVKVKCLVLCLVLYMERQAGNSPGLVWALAEVVRSENQKKVCVGRDPEDHLVQPSCNEQEHLQLDQVSPSPIQPDPECFWGGDLPSLRATCASVSPLPSLTISLFNLV